MGLCKVVLGVGPSKTALLVVICSVCFVHFSASANELQLSTSQTEIPSENSTDSTAQESTVNQYKKVRNNVIRYGAIYRGNSTIRNTRAFTRRPKASRKDKHRHSTKVDTTKPPIVLLPPVLSFKNSENVQIEKYDPFVINVISSEQPLTTSPSVVTNPYSPEYENISQKSNIPNNDRAQPVSNPPYVDEKIMAMKNFGVRMQGKPRGDIRFQSTLSPRSEGGTGPALNDYTPPPTFYPSVQKLRQVGKQSHRRRTRVRTTTIHPYVITEVSTKQTLPRENQYENSLSQKVVENPSTPSTQTEFDSRSNTDNSDFLGGQVDFTTYPAYSDFTNSSLADVLNYDIQRTSPRPIFSLDATGPIKSVEVNQSPTHPPPLDSRFDANTPDVRYEGGDFLNDNPVSSPGSPTTHLDEYFSNVHEVSSSVAPRTEINVATSTSQFVDSPTPKTDDGKVYELKDLIYPPLNILAPPFLEDVFHDKLGNVILNATESPESAPQAEVTSPYSEVSSNNLSGFVENNVPSEAGEWDASTPSAQSSPQPYRENYEDNSVELATGRNDRPAHQVSSQYIDCENGDCLKNESAVRPWTNVPFSPSDVKVLSDTDGLALINRMYENLLRVLNGGPDYYDLSEEPQNVEVDEQAEPIQKTTTKPSNLLAEESGDIRNARLRGKPQNSLVQAGQRTSRRKENYNKGIEKFEPSEENQDLKRARANRKASQLCNSKTLSYVADVSSGCKVFYICTEYGVGEPMLCPNGTLFNQDYLVCDWWYNVECS